MALISLVYVSFASNKNMTNDDLKVILNRAREKNQRRDITGMLLYRSGFFIQALEGEDVDVLGTFAIIRQDPRHRNLLVIYKSPIKKRSFTDWSMGFNVIDNDTLKSLDGFSDFLDKPMTADFFSSNPDHVMTLLNNFRDSSSL